MVLLPIFRSFPFVLAILYIPTFDNFIATIYNPLNPCFMKPNANLALFLSCLNFAINANMQLVFSPQNN